MLEDIIREAKGIVREAVEEYYPDIDSIMAVIIAVLGYDSNYAKAYIRSLGEKSEEKWNDGTNYEESLSEADKRIVRNLREEIAELIAVGITVDEASEYIPERYSATRTHDISRIMVTEKTRIEAEYEIEKGERYIYRCMKDGKQCSYCDELDGTVFLSSQAVIGETLPPMHPWCRCWVETWTN